MRLKSPKSKRRKSNDQNLCLVSAGISLPHADKEATGGEDAYMIQIGKNGGGAIGVADGVGGWNAKGVNPAAYSRALMHFSRRYLLEDYKRKQEAKIKPEGLFQLVLKLIKDQLDKANPSSVQQVMNAAQNRSKVAGSATMVLAKLDGSAGLLEVGNLGDAGLRIIRQGGVADATEDQQYEFDMPFQMACQQFVDIQYNTAADANFINIEVQEGDWVIAGSDGLFDNMFDEEIIKLQTEAELRGSQVGDDYFVAQVVARALAERARRYSRDPLRRVPYAVAFAQEQQEEDAGNKIAQFFNKSNPANLGGKPDDITVIAAKVTTVKKAVLSAADKDARQLAKQVQAIAEEAIGRNAMKKQRVVKPLVSTGTIKVKASNRDI
eukprot:CAMPEP_0196582184 /NCGR_PEP_ID=MMETSP1081-20130531/37901_1 /TAXON_ID=36882 /ORGANISM="Pyramimonas amylifera, Strain CCMP720" /LENGTH=379 /DNA_ID=CAMNT_0041902679 /DNA_START=179 /DNA_END=1318 /DNA_ORIENTATION=-